MARGISSSVGLASDIGQVHHNRDITPWQSMKGIKLNVLCSNCFQIQQRWFLLPPSSSPVPALQPTPRLLDIIVLHVGLYRLAHGLHLPLTVPIEAPVDELVYRAKLLVMQLISAAPICTPVN